MGFFAFYNRKLFLRTVETDKNNFDRYFKVLSYFVPVCGLLALFFSGGIGVAIFLAFAALIAVAWFLEDSQWQITERIGVIILIVFYPVDRH